VVQCIHDFADRLPATSSVHYTTHCTTQSSAPEVGQNNFPKHDVLTGIINKPLLLHLVGCLYYLYECGTFKKIIENEIYLLIKYINKELKFYSIVWTPHYKKPLDPVSAESYWQSQRTSSLMFLYFDTMQYGTHSLCCLYLTAISNSDISYRTWFSTYR
jgi:hypothetical protein